jgi:hypothetical protein
MKLEMVVNHPYTRVWGLWRWRTAGRGFRVLLSAYLVDFWVTFGRDNTNA